MKLTPKMTFATEPTASEMSPDCEANGVLHTSAARTIPPTVRTEITTTSNHATHRHRFDGR